MGKFGDLAKEAFKATKAESKSISKGAEEGAKEADKEAGELAKMRKGVTGGAFTAAKQNPKAALAAVGLGGIGVMMASNSVENAQCRSKCVTRTQTKPACPTGDTPDECESYCKGKCDALHPTSLGGVVGQAARGVLATGFNALAALTGINVSQLETMAGIVGAIVAALWLRKMAAVAGVWSPHKCPPCPAK